MVDVGERLREGISRIVRGCVVHGDNARIFASQDLIGDRVTNSIFAQHLNNGCRAIFFQLHGIFSRKQTRFFENVVGAKRAARIAAFGAIDQSNASGFSPNLRPIRYLASENFRKLREGKTAAKGIFRPDDDGNFLSLKRKYGQTFLFFCSRQRATDRG